MFSRIVVGTDGSTDATDAVKLAGQMASIAPVGTVHVVTAYEPLTPSELQRLDRDLPDEFHDQLTGDLIARPVMEEAASILTARGIPHTAHEVTEEAATAILSLARKVKADLIVVGSRGEGAVDRLRHGSTSTKVMHDAPCSVLVVKR